MKKFKNFIGESVDGVLLNEAKFSNNNLKRVSELLAKIASKRLNAKFQYAWSDEFKKASGEKGIGNRYMSTEGLQIRFNNVSIKNSFSVNSVDFWKKGDTLTEPSMSIFFNEGVNIVRVVQQTFDSIKAGKVVPIKLKDVMNESDLDTLDTLDTLDALDDLDDLDEATKDQRATFVNLQGLPKSYANSAKKWEERLKTKGLEAEWEEWITVKTNDSEITKFDNQIKEDEKKFKGGEYFANPDTVFQDLEQAAKVIAEGKWRSLVVCGQAGVGKCVAGNTMVEVQGL